MAIHKQIRHLRKKAKLTQLQLADRAGVGLRFVKELEGGKPTVRIDKVNQILDFLGAHLEVVKDKPEEF